MSVQKRQANGNAGRPADAGVLARAEQEPKSRRRSTATVVTGTGVWMSKVQRNLVWESVAKVEAIAEAAAGLFYDKVIELDPSP